MLTEENFKALTENQSIDFDSILHGNNANNACIQQQIAGCLYMVSCIESVLAVRNELEQRLESTDLAEQKKQEYMTAVSGITDSMSDLTISFGKASVTIDINYLDAYDYLITFLQFVANNASIYLS